MRNKINYTCKRKHNILSSTYITIKLSINMPNKITKKNNNKLTIFLDQHIDEITQQPAQTTTTTKQSQTSPSPSTNNPQPLPSPPKRITRKRKTPPTAPENSSSQQEPTPQQSKPTQEKQELYKQKKEQCIYRDHIANIGQAMITTKDRTYSNCVELTLYEQSKDNVKQLKEQVMIKQGSKLQVFGDDTIWMVAGVSKPISGHHITLYLYTRTQDVKDFPLFDVVQKVEGEGVGEELVLAQLWWANLLRQDTDNRKKQKGEAAKKRVIKKEQKETHRRGNARQNNLGSQDALNAITAGFAGLKEETA